MASSKGVVEGIPTLNMVNRRAQELALDMPITFAIHDLVHSIMPRDECIRRLMHLRLMEEFPPTFEDLI